MLVAGADDPFTWALAQFHIEAVAAKRDAERSCRRALIDWAMDRMTYVEMHDAADVALAHTAARLIQAMGEIARTCDSPRAPLSGPGVGLSRPGLRAFAAWPPRAASGLPATAS